MDLDDFISYIRNGVLRDTADPVLWPDEDLIRWADEGLHDLARRAGYKVETFSFDTAPGEPAYDIPRLVSVVSVSVDSAPIRRFVVPEDAPVVSDGQQKPYAYSTDIHPGGVYLYPTPDAVWPVSVTYRALPQSVEATNSIPLSHDLAMALADYVVYRALSANEPEGAQFADPTMFLARWEQAVLRAKEGEFRRRYPYNNQVIMRRWVV